MPLNPQNLSDEQFKIAQNIFQSTSKWLVDEAENNKLIIQKSDSRLIGETGTPTSRVNFDGRTTRWRPNTESELIKSRISSCREAYENAGIITNAIDLMVDFALEGIILVHENKSIQRFYEKWMKRVKIADILEQIIKAFFIDSNVPIISFRGRISTPEIRRFRLSVSKQDGASVSQRLFTDLDITKRRVIPYKYAVLDILRLHIEGADLLGNLAYEYDLEPEDRKRLKDPSHQFSEDLQKLKEAVGDRDFSHLVQSGRLRIDPSRISLLYYKKDGYRRWANPYLWRTIDDLRFKKLLRDMDISVAESVINVFTIIKLGNTPAGFPATPEMFQKFAALLATKTKSPNLIWNDLVSLEAEYPPVDKILGEAKYEQVNKEIRSAIGIPEVILTGAGKGNFANSFLAVKTLIERLEGARQHVLRWLNEQVLVVADAMGFRKPPFIKMAHIDLTDEGEQKRLMLEMVDRGMISYQTCVEAFGENFEIEIQRMKEEDQFRRKNEKKFPYVLIKTGKFGPMLTNGPVPLFHLLDSETLDNRQVNDNDVNLAPTQQEQQGQKGGRPIGTKKPQQKKQEPRNKPQGQDNSGKPSGKANAGLMDVKISQEFFDTGKQIFDKLYPAISKAFVKKLGLKDARSLRDVHKEQIFDIISYIISQYGSAKEVTNKNAELLIRSIKYQSVNSENLNDSLPKLNDQTKNIVRKLIMNFKEVNGFLPSKNEARDIIASAYALK